MTRYYYDNPFVVGWMEEEHGFRFQDFDGDEFVDFHPGDYDDYRIFGEDRRAYIHPDSLHLLEPQEGDRGFAGDYWPVEFIPWTTGAAWSHLNIESGNMSFYDEDDKEIKIIQRDGKPFHWPKSE